MRPTSLRSVVIAAGQLALSAQAVLDARDDAIGRLRRSLEVYDREIQLVADRERRRRRRNGA